MGGWDQSGSWLRIGTGASFCEYGDEPSGSGATVLVIPCVTEILNVLTVCPASRCSERSLLTLQPFLH
jgi:hypothetical protein